jgi:hypothetical protein
MTARQIRQTFQLSYYEYRKVISGHQQQGNRRAPALDTSRHFGPEHIAFLTDKDNLAQWYGLSLYDRCRLFESRFPDKKLSYNAIRLIYQNYRVKKRILSKVYVLPQKTFQKQFEDRKLTFPLVLNEIMGVNGTFLFADEAMFTKGYLHNLKVYAPKGTLRPVIPTGRASFPAVAAIAGITPEGQVLASLTRKKAITSSDFIEFLLLAAQRCTKPPLTVFVDQHPLHKTAEVNAFCRQKGIKLLLNAAYSSEYNAVERLWILANKARPLVTVPLNSP